MKFLMMIFFVLILTACSDIPISQKIQNRVVYDYSRKFEKETHFSLIAISGSTPVDKITMIGAEYLSPDAIQIPEARRLTLKALHGLNREINSSKELQPHLQEKPFPKGKTEIDLVFLDFKKNNFYDPPYVASTYAKKGFITYKFYDTKTERFIRREKESYEDAVAIVEGRKPDTLTSRITNLQHVENDSL